MGKEFSIAPKTVPHVETKHRRIVTPIPHPDSVPTLEKLRQNEPQSMRGQPPIVWERAEDIYIYDKYGNRWLDWSSGVLVTKEPSPHCGHVGQPSPLPVSRTAPPVTTISASSATAARVSRRKVGSETRIITSMVWR